MARISATSILATYSSLSPSIMTLSSFTIGSTLSAIFMNSMMQPTTSLRTASLAWVSLKALRKVVYSWGAIAFALAEALSKINFKAWKIWSLRAGGNLSLTTRIKAPQILMTSILMAAGELKSSKYWKHIALSILHSRDPWVIEF